MAPARVVSLLPSATEVLCFIGGAELLVGRSHEDNYPESITHLPVLTGQRTSFTTARDVDAQVSKALKSGESLYTLDADGIKDLAPTVILTQDLCRVCAIDLLTVERVAASMEPPPAIVSLNPESFEEVLDSLLLVGKAVGMEAEAEAARARLLRRVAAVDAAVGAAAEAGHCRPSVAFIEWPDPIYVGGHWTPELIERAGGAHPLNPPSAETRGGGGKSFAIPAETLVASAPELVVVCPCGLPMEAAQREARRLQREAWWSEVPAAKEGRVAVVDGDAMFNRPGPRLVEALEWLAAVINRLPELAPQGFPAEWLAEDAGAGAAAAPDAEVKVLRDIEEAHACAVAKGEMMYTDPVTGYSVFTQLASEQRGYCCGSGCRHCVWGHKNVPEERRATLPKPIVVKR